MKNELIEYKTYNYEDLYLNSKIKDLYKEVFNMDMDKEDEFQKWFIENPHGKAVGVIALLGEKVVGHFTSFPLYLNIKSKVFYAAISAGFMVSNECRGKGIAREMAKLLFQTLKSKGFALIIGFPNGNSFNQHVKYMGYILVKKYLFLSIDYNKEDEYFQTISNFKNDIVGEPDSIQLIRSNDYLNWRFGNEKYIRVKNNKNNYFIATIFQEKADILLWSFGATKREIESFANYLKVFYHVKFVQTWDRKLFKIDEKQNYERYYYFCVKKIDKSLDDDIFDIENWDFYPGDCELY